MKFCHYCYTILEKPIIQHCVLFKSVIYTKISIRGRAEAEYISIINNVLFVFIIAKL